jgi:ribosomal protein S27AE
VGGAFIGATSGIIERSNKKVIAGVLFGLAGGAIGGYFGSVFYGSIMMEFHPLGWAATRMIEGLSGGLVGALLWFSIGIIEKLYIFKRREDPEISEKICVKCGKHNDLHFWYCGSCGSVLQTSAPRQKLVKTPYRGMERIINALHFLSWLFGVTGVITTPVVFFIFLNHNFFLACISAIFTVLFSYLMIVGFRFVSDMFSVLVKLSNKA